MKSNSSTRLVLFSSGRLFPRENRKFFILQILVCTLGCCLFTISANAVIKTSTGNGNWNSSSTWSPSGVPAAGDVVTIAAGHSVVINSNTNSILSLTISGTLTIGNNNTDRTITVAGNITINSGGIFRTAGNGGNTVNVSGNIINNGTFDMKVSSAEASVIFNGNSNQLFSGNGSVTDLSSITLDNSGAANNNILEITTSNFTAENGFLSISDGIFKLSGTFSFTNTFFGTSSPDIDSDEGIWLNNANAAVTAQGGTTNLSGLLRITNGVYNIGTGSSHRLIYHSGAELIMEGGELNISGAFYGSDASDVITYLQSGGTVSVCSVGNNSWFDASFGIYAAASSFTMSGGKIVLEKPATYVSDYLNYSTNSNITGGTIQAGGLLTLLSSVFWINSTPPLFNLELNGLNSPYFQLRSNTEVINDVLIAGTLDASSQNANLTVGGDWINNGIFLPASTAAVTFNGTTPQQIAGLLPTSFNNVVFNNSSTGITLAQTVNVAVNATFTAGILTSSSSSLLIFLDNATASGANNNAVNPSYVHGPVRKIGNDAFTFPVGKAGSGYHPCGISAPLLITDVFTAEYIRGSGSQLGSITSPGLHHVSNCDYWDIDRTLGLSNVNVTLSWNGSSNCNSSAYVTDLSTLVVAHFNGTSWNSHNASSSTGSSVSGSVTRNSCTSFSYFALGSTSAASNPLPVKLSSVRAFASGSNNRVEWTNETESDVIEYRVEKAGPNQNFVTIGKKLPVNNNGGRSSYFILDDNAGADQTSWYRVKIIESSGSIKYSTIVKVTRKSDSYASIAIYPNPLAGKDVTLQLNNVAAGIYTASVFNQSGRKITAVTWEHRGGTVSQSLNLPTACGAGLYLINVKGNTSSFTEKLLVR